MQYKRAYIFNFIGRLIPQSLYLLTTIILARYLSPSEFGAIGVLTIFISLAVTLSDSGFSGSLIQEKNVTSTDYSTIFVCNVFISCFIYIVLCISAKFIESFYAYPQLSNIIYILCPVFIIRAIGIVPKTILIRSINFKLLSNISIVSVFIACLLSILAGINKLGLYSLVIYHLTYALLETLLLIFATKYHMCFKFSSKSLKKLFSFGFFTTLSNLIDCIYENMLTNMFGKTSGMRVAGFYSQASKLENASTNAMVQTLNSVSYPILARKKENAGEFAKEASSIKSTFIRFVFPVIFIIIVFSNEIIGFVYGNDWIESAKYLRLLMYVGLFYILESIERNNIKSLGYVKSILYVTIGKRILGILMIVLCSLISPYYMLYGFILSTALGYICNKFLYCHIINSIFLKSFFNDVKHIFILALLLVFMLITRALTSSFSVAISIIVVLFVIYYFILFATIRKDVTFNLSDGK